MHLAIAPRFNSAGKHDASGAFQPEARAYCRVHGGTPFLFDNQTQSGPRLRQVQAYLASHEPHSIDGFALFSHGYKSGLQIGVSLANCLDLARSLAAVCTTTPVIALYCCDAARDSDDGSEDDRQPGPGGDGGFADKLRDELGKLGVQATIYAHATTGHTTSNPWVRRFDPGEMAGGHWVIEPHSTLWLPWRKALRETDLRFRFPFMDGFMIDRELRGANG